MKTLINQEVLRYLYEINEILNFGYLATIYKPNHAYIITYWIQWVEWLIDKLIHFNGVSRRLRLFYA